MPLLLFSGFLVSLPLLASSCRLNVGCGGDCGNLNLQVPFISNPEFLLCVPTSIQMWRRYDGLPFGSVNGMATTMGCSPYIGCSPQQATFGVRYFTATGNDAYLDDWGGVGDPDQLLAEYASREITSLVNGVPVLAIIDGALHAVVITAGNYSTRTDGLKQWDWVYVQDPNYTVSYKRYSAGAWLDASAYHVVSNLATTGWQTNFSTWSPDTVARGWSHGPICPNQMDNLCV